MSYFPNDTLQKQIIKGQMWTGGYTQLLASGSPATIVVAVGTTKTQFVLELYTEGYIQVQITEDVTAGSAAITDINLDRSGSYSKETVVHQTTGAGGTILPVMKIPAGLSGATTQFSGNAGLVLKESTKYEYEVSAQGAYPVDLQLIWYYRELK
jgi:hypothetical protein